MKGSLCIVVAVAALLAMGCSSGKNKEMLAQKDARISALETELTQLSNQLAEESERSAQLNAQLEETLAEYKAKEQVWLEQKDAKTIITVSDAVLFASGSADITDAGQDIIDRISQVSKQHPDRQIQIEGHTDNVPIGAAYKEKFPSNWELAASRACSVLRYMYWKNKVEPGRLSAIGYGEHRPLESNDTAEGREKNRRVVIVIGALE